MSKKGMAIACLILAALFLLAELWPVQVQAAAEWVKRYNGPVNGDDHACAIAVDGLGNVYVTGYCEWTGSYDYMTTKYNSAGTVQWRRRYDGPSHSDDQAYAIAVDGAGNVYVTGESPALGVGQDYATIKYNSTGTVQWVKRYNGAVNGYDSARAITVDGSGNVYVTGGSRGSGGNQDYATIKYNSAGTRLWVKRYNGPGNGNDKAAAIAVDGSDNVYVTGESRGSGSGQDYATIKYNSSGVPQWVKRYNGAGNGDDAACAIGMDCAGNVYVTGYCRWSANNDFMTIKYSSGGVRQWIRRYNGPGNGHDAATAIAVDYAGTACVSGICRGAGGTYDCATVKYNSAGVQQWVRGYAGPAGGDDYANAITLDNTGNVYIAGASERSPGSNEDCITIKYSSAGVRQWVERYNGPANAADIGYGIAVDGAGNAYVAGYSTGTTTGRDWLVIKY
jgi:uncharacterized delta-60 repeat protein